jgi:hypothetical protein
MCQHFMGLDWFRLNDAIHFSTWGLWKIIMISLSLSPFYPLPPLLWYWKQPKLSQSLLHKTEHFHISYFKKLMGWLDVFMFFIFLVNSVFNINNVDILSFRNWFSLFRSMFCVLDLTYDVFIRNMQKIKDALWAG